MLGRHEFFLAGRNLEGSEPLSYPKFTTVLNFSVCHFTLSQCENSRPTCNRDDWKSAILFYSVDGSTSWRLALDAYTKNNPISSDFEFLTLESWVFVSTLLFSARQHIYYRVLYAIARPSVRLSVTRVDQSKTVEVRITQPSPQSNPMTLVSWRLTSPRNSKGT